MGVLERQANVKACFKKVAEVDRQLTLTPLLLMFPRAGRFAPAFTVGWSLELATTLTRR
jgi:hypothetical protein